MLKKAGLMANKHFTILSIENNVPDFNLLKEALLQIPDLDLDIINITNGKESLDFIFKNLHFDNRPYPDLIILDINLPVIDGYDILRKIKNSNLYRSIPVIMYSTSDAEKDIKESYHLYANSYIIKSFDIDDLFKKIANMGEYWLKTEELPKNGICLIKKNKIHGERE